MYINYHYFYYNFRLFCLNMIEKYLIVCGSASEDTKRDIFRDLFNLNYKNTQKVYQFQKYEIIYYDFCLRTFNENDFIDQCNNIREKIQFILCIQNLNPRPETLENDFGVLTRAFSSTELNEKLNIIFTSSDNLDNVRNSALNYTVIFDPLGITEFQNKCDFVNKKIWLNNTDEINGLKNMLFSKRKNINNNNNNSNNFLKKFNNGIVLVVLVLLLAIGLAVSFTPLPTNNKFDEIGFNKEIENLKEYLIKLGDILKKYADTSNKKFEILTNFITFKLSNNETEDLTVHKLNANSLRTVKEELLKIENDLDQITMHLDKKFDKLKQVGEEFKALSKKLKEVGSFFKSEKFFDDIHSKELIQIGDGLVEYEKYLNNKVDGLLKIKLKTTNFNNFIQYRLDYFFKLFWN